MKKFLIPFFAVMFAIIAGSTNLIAQPYGWFSQSSGTNNNLNDVFMVNQNTGVVVGHSGTILRTTNGGANWVDKSGATSFHIFAVYFVNSNTGYASGDVGVVLKTTNGGNTWTVLNTGISASILNSIHFFNANTGIIAGWYGIIMRTNNGGNTWTQISSGTGINLMGLHFKDANTGLAVGLTGKVIRTVNGGTSWSNVSSGTSNDLLGAFINQNNKGLVLGELGAMRKSTNAGSSWSNQSSGTSRWLSGIHFVDMSTGTIVGDNGTIRRSSNNGGNFLSQSSNTNNWLRGIHYTSITHGVAVGDFGTIRRTTTGGWLLPKTPGLSSPGNNSTCRSLTVNLDWNNISAPVATFRVQVSEQSNFSSTLIDVSNLSATNYNIPSGTLQLDTKYYWRVRATNEVGTGNWSSTRNFRTKVADPGISALNLPANNSVGVSLTPTFDWEDDAASTGYQIQIALDSGFSSPVLSVDTISVSEYTLNSGVLDNSTVYYWRIRGKSSCESGDWSSIWNFKTALLPPLAPVLVSPPSGTIGLNLVFDMDWLDIASADEYRIEISEDSAFSTTVVDSSELTVSNFTVPAGALSSFTKYYWRVSGQNEAGAGPYSPTWNFQTILLTGLNSNTTEIPDEFALNQNYPNPFNPVTTISFDLPENSSVRLDVYNSLGETVSTLVNENLSAGRYSYNMDASGLASGIYFYRIQTGEFIQTKRMVVLK